MGETNDGGRAPTDRGLFADPVLLEQASGTVIIAIALLGALHGSSIGALGRSGRGSLSRQFRTRGQQVLERKLGAAAAAAAAFLLDGGSLAAGSIRGRPRRRRTPVGALLIPRPIHRRLGMRIAARAEFPATWVALHARVSTRPA